jgi:hypothetical protein
VTDVRACRVKRPLRMYFRRAMLEGAVLCCEASPNAIAEAFDAVVGELGYTRSADKADLDVTVVADERAMAFVGELRKTLALALARRLARRLRLRVRVLTARLIEREGSDDEIECAVDDVTVLPDGASKLGGSWAEDTNEAYGADWGLICDGKAYFAVYALLENAREAVLPRGKTGPSLHLRAPASLGSARLDELANQVRLADRATMGNVGGRACIRITMAGATVTSFVDPQEAEALRRALDGLLA